MNRHLQSIRLWIANQSKPKGTNYMAAMEVRFVHGEGSHIKYRFCTEMEFEEDNTVWFICLEHKNKTFSWPERFAFENALEYVTRLANLPDVERHQHIIPHYESMQMIGFFKYNSYTFQVLGEYRTREHRSLIATSPTVVWPRPTVIAPDDKKV